MVKELLESKLTAESFLANVATTPRDEMPRSGQWTSFVRLEYRIVTPLWRAYAISGFQSLNRKFESVVINPIFTALTVEVEGLDVSIVSVTEDCSLGIPFSVVDLETDGDKAESVPWKT